MVEKKLNQKGFVVLVKQRRTRVTSKCMYTVRKKGAVVGVGCGIPSKGVL